MSEGYGGGTTITGDVYQDEACLGHICTVLDSVGITQMDPVGPLMKPSNISGLIGFGADYYDLCSKSALTLPLDLIRSV